MMRAALRNPGIEVDVNPEHMITPFNAFEDFIVNPSPCPRIGTDQDYRYSRIF